MRLRLGLGARDTHHKGATEVQQIKSKVKKKAMKGHLRTQNGRPQNVRTQSHNKTSWRRVDNSPQNSNSKSLKQENKTRQNKNTKPMSKTRKCKEKKAQVLTPNIGCGQTCPVGSRLTQNRNLQEREKDKDSLQSSQS